MKTEIVIGSARLDDDTTIDGENQMVFLFPEFADLPHECGDCVLTPFVSCFGFSWQLVLFPGGSRQSRNKDCSISICLRCVGASTMNVTQTPLMRSSMSVMDCKKGPALTRFSVSRVQKLGFIDFMKRSDVLNPSKGYLVDGSLRVVVFIRIHERQYWLPKPGPADSLVQLLETPEDSDVCFKVGGKDIRAHRCILRLRAPNLLKMIGNDRDSAIELPDLDPAVFRSFLELLYGKEAPTTFQLKQFGPDLLKVADRFDCRKIKHVIESEIAEYIITAENAAEFLVVADSLNCALLKEAAMECFNMNQDVVMESPGWAAVEESKHLPIELLRSQCRSKKRRLISGDGVDDMSVSALRTKLEEKGLDVDGTRAMLVNRLRGEE
uniref:SAP domain-containing protein n=1 Tax=Grammatophora oceanica TaxID=210454 RepID=A0A7S1YJL8_9STRA|mmetsp:Transcript_50198/g.74947  ORF Transcript_50198/g.74947 Transcript_50198/m.74947 type:complete len:381 (+) Transcript_50198:225-1367(+)|eukprot:CAMPEP_0194031358 /NCGR_PEP_ID=MMETSP0009_2-20130614/4546_1 /TAXON_ID=210454 /ORGANISM="Grammatophora oceanica, Strain CCMP 410" /LENGTH=380 /DNA_ID=CAMNT_0038671493 /DNA_START=225 /DNA_END=1367 /DNA_ORIENTATION=+